GGRTRDQLYEEAKDAGIDGRSKMNKAQLQAALARKTGRKSA
ncbi:MAG TPA: plasmid stabilization protein, partial [Actinomycetota bacterium]